MEGQNVKSFADVVAGRDSNQAALNGDLNAKFRTSKVCSLKITNRPEGCNGKHCKQDALRCNEPQCINEHRSDLAATKEHIETLTARLNGFLEDIDHILREIATYCRTDDLYYPAMEESRVALETAVNEQAEDANCDCTPCELENKKREMKMLKTKGSVAKDRLTVLNEYRRANDKETLERISSGYAKGGKYFTPVGGSKAKGVKALRPSLQMQSSYDVVALTTNSMEERPLIVSGKKRKKRNQN